MLSLTVLNREEELHSGFNSASKGKTDLNRNLLASYKGSEEEKCPTAPNALSNEASSHGESQIHCL